MTETLRLHAENILLDLLTGVYSEETHLPQPLRVSVTAELPAAPHYAPGTPLGASKSYLDLRDAVDRLPRDVHFTLVESIADSIADAVFVDPRVGAVEVRIDKLAIARGEERIGIHLRRTRA